ncbi:MAG: hypothetical protein NZ932_03815 [Candidatus Bathyarchaeota archaeon]|nr:hypothetical protein [Candidatus Bathyarchaeota archaeon]MDW8022405.1 hypothetical protein [Nitrososphaerota archaeon]
MTYNLERDFGVEIIAEIISYIKKYKDVNIVKRKVKMSTERFDYLIATLNKLKLIKNLSGTLDMTSPITIVTPKGEEFLRRYQNLIQFFNATPNTIT